MAARSGDRPLTERDRYWLRHHEACEESGLTAKAYGRRHRLSVHALYQARKRLRAMGALGAASTRPSRAKQQSTSGFTRVGGLAAPRPRYRVRFPNGSVVEWEGAAGLELVEVLSAAYALGSAGSRPGHRRSA